MSGYDRSLQKNYHRVEKKINYFYVGQETVILNDEIIGIFDLDNTTVSKNTRDFLKRAEQEKKVINVSPDLPKSFILCYNSKIEEKIYITQTASRQLEARSRKLINN